MAKEKRIADAVAILEGIGMPSAQRNDRSALCLLALVNLTKGKPWAKAENPLIGITPMMEFALSHYGRRYAPNTRETFRRQTVHQLVAAGVALSNPDNPLRPINSPKTIYQIEPEALALVRSFNTSAWNENLRAYIQKRPTLSARYAQDRAMQKLAVKFITGETIASVLVNTAN